MIDAICKSCGARYPLSTEHVCSKAKRAPAKKSTGPLLYASRPASTGIVGKERPKSVKKSKGGNLARGLAILLGDADQSAAADPAGGAPILPAASPAATPKRVRAKNAHTQAEAAAAHLAPKRRGRPTGPVPFDKKAHDRKKSAERRAAAKDAK